MGHRDIPVLETNRLLLKGPQPEDYPNFKATFTSFRARYMGGPLNPYEAWMLYAAEIGHWEIRGYGMWMIHDKESDETYGMAGAWYPAMWPEREIAWIIWPEVAGRGIALEAVSAVRRHVYDVLNWDTVVTYVDPYDLDSVRLCERLGCTKDKEAKTIGDDDAVYRHPAPNALKNSQLADGIAMEIAHYADPGYKPKGFPLD